MDFLLGIGHTSQITDEMCAQGMNERTLEATSVFLQPLHRDLSVGPAPLLRLMNSINHLIWFLPIFSACSVTSPVHWVYYAFPPHMINTELYFEVECYSSSPDTSRLATFTVPGDPGCAWHVMDLSLVRAICVVCSFGNKFSLWHTRTKYSLCYG